MNSPYRSTRALLLLCFPTLWFSRVVNGLGQEKAAFPQPTYEGVWAWKQRVARSSNTEDSNIQNATATDVQVSYRQDICHRYDQVRRGEIPLRDALIGLPLRPLMRVNKFFRYTDEEGIHPLDPGLMAVMMDELARRAGFTWRESFAVVHALPTKPVSFLTNETDDEGDALTFTDLLLWSVETHDLSINWWDRTLERLEGGASFMYPWFDGSIIMVRHMSDPVVDEGSIDLWNWLRPFDRGVWLMTSTTIIVSAIAYQWIEYLSGHGRGRTWWQWFLDNLYLSAINFPQNYEFEPKSFAGRLFGVSISLWALLMTATYTANLASLLVDTKTTTFVVESMDDAVTANIPLCVYENTGADAFVQQKYRQARRIPFDSELGTFQALQEGQCEITVAYYQNWLGFAQQKAYNPTCDLEWVGRTVKTIQSGFANAVDTGDKCTSLIGNVLDVYLNEMEETGFIEDMWDEHYAKSQDINCDAVSPEVLQAQSKQDAARKLVSQQQPRSFWKRHQHPTSQNRRELKAGAKSAAAAGATAGSVETDADASQMTLNQMAGTFVLHFWLMGSAIVIGYITRFYKKRGHHVEAWMSSSSERFMASFIPNKTVDSTAKTCHTTAPHHQNTTSTERPGDEESSGEQQQQQQQACLVAAAAATTPMTKRQRRRHNQEHLHDHHDAHESFDNDDEDELRQDLHETQQELSQTRRELQETRQDLKNQLQQIVQLLSAQQQQQQQGTEAVFYG